MLRIPTPRLWSNNELKMVIPQLGDYDTVINVSGWKDLDKQGAKYQSYFPKASIYDISNYDGDDERGGTGDGQISVNLDEHLDPKLEGKYDIAFSHTVLEHVVDPVFAFDQIAKLTSDLIITVVPFKQKMHFEPGQYGDYYRFTPMTMRRYHEKNGFEVIYESFTPRPSLDVYLLHVGTRQPELHKGFTRHIADYEKLNSHVGGFRASDLLRNVVSRALDKYLK